MYVIKRKSKYVAKPVINPRPYVTSLKNAQLYPTREAAEANAHKDEIVLFVPALQGREA